MRSTTARVPVSVFMGLLALGAGCGEEEGVDAGRGGDDAGGRMDASAGTDAGGTGADAGLDAGATGEPCTDHADCGPGDFCKYEGSCGGSGSCQFRPATCEDTCAKVCGCDGLTYDNECVAHRERVTVDHAGTCEGWCDPMDAVGNGDSTCPLGHAWTGSECRLIRGCGGCTGADCDRLMTFEECSAYQAACEAPSC